MAPRLKRHEWANTSGHRSAAVGARSDDRRFQEWRQQTLGI